MECNYQLVQQKGKYMLNYWYTAAGDSNEIKDIAIIHVGGQMSKFNYGLIHDIHICHHQIFICTHIKKPSVQISYHPHDTYPQMC